MPKIDQVLIDLVKEEAAKLREALKPSEAAKLDFSELDGESKFRCIYGQATGNCESGRAITLIKKCCSRVYDATRTTINEAPLNGKPTKDNISPKVGMFSVNRNHFSPIEKFILLAGKRRNKKLIQYLRKEIDTLDI